jgi:cell division protein FtsB
VQKRRAQLRDAQRGLRERKNRHLEELQARVAELERENSTLKSNHAV